MPSKTKNHPEHFICIKPLIFAGTYKMGTSITLFYKKGRSMTASGSTVEPTLRTHSVLLLATSRIFLAPL